MAKRKIWFITRPERDPKFHKDALIALAKATNNFTVKWEGNRLIQKEYEKQLHILGIKRENISNDGSGGRTWAAMLKTFSYIYVNEEGFIVPAKSALKLLSGIKVRENVTKQILTLQIPNAYFLDSGFRPEYEEGFQIRPARFIIKLTNQELLDYTITREEIIFFVLTAKKDNQLEEITKRIIAFRNADDAEKIKATVADEYDHRERSDKDARDYQSNNSDVAHTFMLICEYTGLVEYVRGESILTVPQSLRKNTAIVLADYDERYPFNKRYLISLERLAENNGLDVDSFKASSYYGSGKVASSKSKTLRKVQNILLDLPNPAGLSDEELKTLLLNELSPKETEEALLDIRRRDIQAISSEFVENYLNEPDNLKFEDLTGEILKQIGFEIAMRPLPVLSAKTKIEILAKYGDCSFGIIDAKNYKQKFTLSANLASYMASEYIPNYYNYEGRSLTFFGYITASNIAGENNLNKVSQDTRRLIPDKEIKGFMMSASSLIGFLDYCIENDIPKSERIRLFLKCAGNKSYVSTAQLLKEVL